MLESSDQQNSSSDDVDFASSSSSSSSSLKTKQNSFFKCGCCGQQLSNLHQMLDHVKSEHPGEGEQQLNNPNADDDLVEDDDVNNNSDDDDDCLNKNNNNSFSTAAASSKENIQDKPLNFSQMLKTQQQFADKNSSSSKVAAKLEKVLSSIVQNRTVGGGDDDLIYDDDDQQFFAHSPFRKRYPSLEISKIPDHFTNLCVLVRRLDDQLFNQYFPAYLECNSNSGGRVVRCRYCDQLFYDKAIWAQHMSKHVADGVRGVGEGEEVDVIAVGEEKKEKGVKKLNRKKKLKVKTRDLNRFKNASTKWKCPQCGLLMSHKSSLRRHLRRQHKPPSSSSSSSSSIDDDDNRKNVDVGEENVDEENDVNSKTKYFVDDGVVTVVGEDNNEKEASSFPCTLCDRVFMTTFGLDRHAKLQHPGQKIQAIFFEDKHQQQQQLQPQQQQLIVKVVEKESLSGGGENKDDQKAALISKIEESIETTDENNSRKFASPLFKNIFIGEIFKTDKQLHKKSKKRRRRRYSPVDVGEDELGEEVGVEEKRSKSSPLKKKKKLSFSPPLKKHQKEEPRHRNSSSTTSVKDDDDYSLSKLIKKKKSPLKNTATSTISSPKSKKSRNVAVVEVAEASSSSSSSKEDDFDEEEDEEHGAVPAIAFVDDPNDSDYEPSAESSGVRKKKSKRRGIKKNQGAYASNSTVKQTSSAKKKTSSSSSNKNNKTDFDEYEFVDEGEEVEKTANNKTKREKKLHSVVARQHLKKGNQNNRNYSRRSVVDDDHDDYVEDDCYSDDNNLMTTNGESAAAASDAPPPMTSSSSIYPVDKCAVCGSLFVCSSLAYQSHIEQHRLYFSNRCDRLGLSSNADDLLACHQCKLCFSTKLAISQHRRLQHNRNYNIDDYDDDDDRSSMITSSSNRSGGDFDECDDCGARFQSLEALIDHKIRVHSEEKRATASLRSHYRPLVNNADIVVKKAMISSGSSASDGAGRRRIPPEVLSRSMMISGGGESSSGGCSRRMPEGSCRSQCEHCRQFFLKPSTLIEHMSMNHRCNQFSAQVETVGMPPFRIYVERGRICRWNCCQLTFECRPSFVQHRSEAHGSGRSTPTSTSTAAAMVEEQHPVQQTHRFPASCMTSPTAQPRRRYLPHPVVGVVDQATSVMSPLSKEKTYVHFSARKCSAFGGVAGEHPISDSKQLEHNKASRDRGVGGDDSEYVDVLS